MNCVERVKQLCKERRIPISKLEKDLGFANGYIGQLKKGTLPVERATKIANYFEVSLSEILTEEESSASSRYTYYPREDGPEKFYHYSYPVKAMNMLRSIKEEEDTPREAKELYAKYILSSASTRQTIDALLNSVQINYTGDLEQTPNRTGNDMRQKGSDSDDD